MGRFWTVENKAQEFLQYHVTKSDGRTIIHIDAIADPMIGTFRPTINNIRGITFYVPDPAHAEIEIGETPVPADLIERNPSDGIGSSIGIKWYPSDTTNYATTAPNIHEA